MSNDGNHFALSSNPVSAATTHSTRDHARGRIQFPVDVACDEEWERRMKRLNPHWQPHHIHSVETA